MAFMSVSSRIALVREVGVRTGAVPVALHRLGVERDDHVVVLGDAVEQPAGHVQVVADGQRVGGADLELPLAGHDLGVGAFDHQAGVDARLGVLLDDLAADRRGRRRRRSSTGPAGRGSRRRGSRAGCRRASGTCTPARCRRSSRAWRTSWRPSRSAARVLVGCGLSSLALSHLAQHEHVVAAADRVGADEHRAAASQSLCSPVAWLVDEPSKPQIGGVLAVGEDLGLRTEQRCRLGAVDPDVFSLVGHGDSFGWGRECGFGARWRGEAAALSQRGIARRFRLCERCVKWSFARPRSRAALSQRSSLVTLPRWQVCGHGSGPS